MTTTIIDNIPFEIRPDQIFPHLKIKPGSSREKQFNSLINLFADIARPKVAYKLVAVEHGDSGIVFLDDLSFKSKILQVNLQTCQRVFAFIATCGIELESLAKEIDNPMEVFWADKINMMALEMAIKSFKNYIRESFQTGPTSTMNPGSLTDWPLTQQQKLFMILGEAVKSIDVRLSPSGMMIPLKSVSGIEFESDEKFYNCQLCPRHKCPSRRASYDENLLMTKYN